METSNTIIHEASVTSDDASASIASATTGADNAQPHDIAGVSETKIHWILLVLSVAIVTLSCVLRVPGKERVILPLVNVALPGLCYTREFIGIPCPGCGLTRCFISLAHGEFTRALQFNPAGVLLFGFVVCQIPYRLTQIFRVVCGRQPFNVGDITWPIYIFLAVLIIQWLGKLISFWV